MDIVYRGYTIIEHYGASDVMHYHWGKPDSAGRMTVPMDCDGPAPKSVREYYGTSDAGGCESVEECRAEIDREFGSEEHS